jgi:hypothetical protein
MDSLAEVENVSRFQVEVDLVGYGLLLAEQKGSEARVSMDSTVSTDSTAILPVTRK